MAWDGSILMLRAVRRVLRMAHRAVSPEARGVRALEQNWQHSLFQPYPTTTWHRHPPLFAAVKDALTDISEPRLLSYGCSTGEEAFSLKEIIPNAQITAIDINPRSIAIARRTARRLRVEGIDFACAAAPPPRGAIAPFDAIFCLSVLRHARLEAECPESCADILPFARAQALLHRLDDLLRPRGFLVLWGSNFRLRDTGIASQYAWVPVNGRKPHRGPFYDRDDRRLDAQDTSEFLFQKVSCPPTC